MGVLLTEDLRTDRNMYDASHYLMVPMYYAFYSADEDTAFDNGMFQCMTTCAAVLRPV